MEVIVQLVAVVDIVIPTTPFVNVTACAVRSKIVNGATLLAQKYPSASKPLAMKILPPPPYHLLYGSLVREWQLP